MDDCIFCKVIAGELPSTKAYEDKEIVVIKDIHSQAKVHWLVMPKTHVSEFIEADTKLTNRLMDVVGKVIRKEHIANYRIVANGKGAAFVDHLHIHVMGGIEKMRRL